MKYSVLKPVLAKFQELISSLIEYIKENTLNFVLSSLGIILTATIILILNYHYSAKLWYILIFGVIVCIYFMYNILNRRKRRINIEELKRANISLNRLNGDLKDQVSSLNSRLTDLENQLKDCNHLPQLETNFPKILTFFQMLNITIEGLPDSDIGFVNLVGMEQNLTMMTYGYKFVDYANNETLYDTEYQPLERPKLISRAIVDKSNNLIVKGRIYLPLNYGSDQR